MTDETPHPTLSHALRHAMSITVSSWAKANCPGEETADAWPMYANRIEVQLQFAPHGRGWISTTVHDNRPGRSHSSYYRVDAIGSGSYRMTSIG
jgi:hypothetical protein